jgi:SAM-dependent methyltransferase
MARLVFTESLALLGATDIHPGGRDATNFLLDELQKANPRRVLEIGAGSGATTERMMKRGWQVTPIEPSRVLRRVLEKRLGISVHPEEFESFDEGAGGFDAAIAESVFYCLDHAAAFAKVHRLLRPGGLLAFIDMVWTDRGDPALAASIHDRSTRTFGIPTASREWLTWPKWKQCLEEAGFAEVVARRLPPDSLPANQSMGEARSRVAPPGGAGALPALSTILRAELGAPRIIRELDGRVEARLSRASTLTG